MDEKKQFTIYNKIIDFDNYLRKNIIINIPNIYRDIRIHLLDECYYLEKNMFYATYNKGNIRMKYLIEIKVNLSVIDMFLIKISNLNCVKSNKYNSCVSKLNDIKNIIYGWIINEEKKKN